MSEKTEYIDDENITDEDLLLKRIPLNPTCISYCKKLKRLRPVSSLYNNTAQKDASGNNIIGENGKVVRTYMSAYVSSELKNNDLYPGSILEDHQDKILVHLTVGSARLRDESDNLQQRVFLKPNQTPPLYEKAHGGVAGKKNDKVKSVLARKSKWFIAPLRHWVMKHRDTLRIPKELDIENQLDALFQWD